METSGHTARLNGPVALIVSPHAGRGRGPDAASALRHAGVEVAEELPVSDLDHRWPRGAEWARRGIRTAVAAGGDGTLGAVASQVAGSGVALGILPLGTSNDSARSLTIPLDLDDACSVIAHGIPTPIDVGQVLPALTEPGGLSPQHQDPTAPPSQQAEQALLAAHGAYFLHALTLGLNVHFARLATDVARRERWGPLTYAASALQALTQFEPAPIVLTLSGVALNERNGQLLDPDDDLVIMRRVLQVAVVNLPVFGGAINLRLPGSAPQRHLFDIVLIEALETQALRTTLEGLLAQLDRLRDTLFGGGADSEADTETVAASAAAVGTGLLGVHRYRARAARIETPHGVDVTLDGEIRARTPVNIRVAQDMVQVLLPEDAHTRLLNESDAR
ncbi:MAG TPA: diacylglycerol kinase family protein [Ktedonobacterales bacterium]